MRPQTSPGWSVGLKRIFRAARTACWSRSFAMERPEVAAALLDQDVLDRAVRVDRHAQFGRAEVGVGDGRGQVGQARGLPLRPARRPIARSSWRRWPAAFRRR